MAIDGSPFVRADGTLDDTIVSGRETLYVTVSGAAVERFQAGNRSYIFKPLPTSIDARRELWAQQTILPNLPSVRAARIEAVSEDDERAWIIYEDLGRLRHCQTPDDIIAAAGWIAEWHRLPVAMVPAEYAGHTPRIGEIARQVLAEADRISERIAGVKHGQIEAWCRLVKASVIEWSNNAPVVSHGDYHPLNVAVEPARRVVIDWEYTQRNHRYWDVYSLLDMTSFRYNKVPLRPKEREDALLNYWNNLSGGDRVRSLQGDGPGSGRVTSEHFARGYFVYASVYSAWIAGLIEGDLARGQVSREKLMVQLDETSVVFRDCMDQIME